MGLKIYGIAAVESPDRVGEKIIIKDMDTSRLRYINDEHGDDMFSMIGAITGHKKVLSQRDCETPRQLECWNQVKAPFLYVEGSLADDHDHPNAEAAAALMKFCNQHKELPLKVGFSIEGHVIQRSGENNKELVKTAAEGVSLTIKPCHPNAQAFLDKDLIKSHVQIPMPQKYVEALKKSGFSPSFKETDRNDDLLPKLQELKKSLQAFHDGITSIQCKRCGQSTRMFKSSKEWPNACEKCGTGYKMKQIFKALTKE